MPTTIAKTAHLANIQVIEASVFVRCAESGHHQPEPKSSSCLQCLYPATTRSTHSTAWSDCAAFCLCLQNIFINTFNGYDVLVAIMTVFTGILMLIIFACAKKNMTDKGDPIQFLSTQHLQVFLFIFAVLIFPVGSVLTDILYVFTESFYNPSMFFLGSIFLLLPIPCFLDTL